MAAGNLRYDIVLPVATPLALTTAAGDAILGRVGVPMRIMRWGVVVTTAIVNNSTPAQYKIDQRITPGSDSGRVNISTMVHTASATYAIGKVLKKEVGVASTTTNPAVDGSITVAGQSQGYVCNTGDEIVFVVSVQAGTTAGAGCPYFEYAVLSDKDGSTADAVNL